MKKHPKRPRTRRVPKRSKRPRRGAEEKSSQKSGGEGNVVILLSASERKFLRALWNGEDNMLFLGEAGVRQVHILSRFLNDKFRYGGGGRSICLVVAPKETISEIANVLEETAEAFSVDQYYGEIFLPGPSGEKPCLVLVTSWQTLLADKANNGCLCLVKIKTAFLLDADYGYHLFLKKKAKFSKVRISAEQVWLFSNTPCWGGDTLEDQFASNDLSEIFPASDELRLFKCCLCIISPDE